MTFNELIKKDKPVVIDFFATWCGPCKMQTPILHDLKDKMGDTVDIIKIDIDKNRSIANALGVRSVPTVMIFKNGEPKYRNAGVHPADKLEEIIGQIS